MDVLEALENVDNRESFIRFVRLLIEDNKSAGILETANPEKYVYVGANGWENGSIETFLDGAVSWLEASKRADISWKLMAEFLYCGKIYE